MKRAIPAAEFASGDGILVSRIPFESGFTSVLGQFIPVCFAGFNQFFLGREISPILFVHPLNRSSLTTRLEDFPGFGGRETDYFVLVRVAAAQTIRPASSNIHRTIKKCNTPEDKKYPSTKMPGVWYHKCPFLR